jgi:hypothetical protein
MVNNVQTRPLFPRGRRKANRIDALARFKPPVPIFDAARRKHCARASAKSP